MRLAIANYGPLAVLVLSLCLAQASSAQQATAAKPGAATESTAAPASKAPTPPKPKAKAKSKPEAKEQASAPAAPAGEQNVAVSTEPAGKRDPFAALINNQRGAGAGVHLPPGKAGLVIATVRVDGAVRSGTGMIAIVSNPGNSVYFIREGDRLYDGSVEKIGLDGVTFREDSKDAFGHPIERTVTKRIYAVAGE